MSEQLHVRCNCGCWHSTARQRSVQYGWHCRKRVRRGWQVMVGQGCCVRCYGQILPLATACVAACMLQLSHLLAARTAGLPADAVCHFDFTWNTCDRCCSCSYAAARAIAVAAGTARACCHPEHNRHCNQTLQVGVSAHMPRTE